MEYDSKILLLPQSPPPPARRAEFPFSPRLSDHCVVLDTAVVTYKVQQTFHEQEQRFIPVFAISTVPFA